MVRLTDHPNITIAVYRVGMIIAVYHEQQHNNFSVKDRILMASVV